jgi:hypothetical protein
MVYKKQTKKYRRRRGGAGAGAEEKKSVFNFGTGSATQSVSFGTPTAPMPKFESLLKDDAYEPVRTDHSDLASLLVTFKSDKTKTNKDALLTLLDLKIKKLTDPKDSDTQQLLKEVKGEVESSEVKMGGYKKKSRRKSTKMRKRMSRRGGTYKMPGNM